MLEIMKPLRQWNAPLGLIHVFGLGLVLVGSMVLWMGFLRPQLASLLASQRSFAEGYPFLYDLADIAIAFTILPWLFGVVS